MGVKNQRLLFGLSALFFLALTLIGFRIGRAWTCFEQDCWIGLIALGGFVSIAFLAVHFLLKTLLFKRPRLAAGISHGIALFVALPLTPLALVFSIGIVALMIETRKEIPDFLLDLLFVIVALDVPVFLLWRHAVRALTESSPTQ